MPDDELAATEGGTVRFIRRNAIALTALVLSMTGTGIAASQYIITSTNQIKPSVLRQLRGDAEASASKVELEGAKAVVDRAHLVAPVETTTGLSNVPLADSIWVQGPGELEQFAVQITLTPPSVAECTFKGFSTGAVELKVSLDGRVMAERYESNEEPGTVTIPLVVSLEGSEGWLFEPGHPETHTLTARAVDDCGREGGHSGGHFTIDAVSIDVIGVR
ncbi:MAG TPA: hypothetical protein VIH92_06640 [Solirubrobacteraceae bacterium]